MRPPAIIERDDARLRRNLFFAATPGKEVAHRNHGEAVVLDLLHLLFEFRRLDDEVLWLLLETVIAQDDY